MNYGRTGQNVRKIEQAQHPIRLKDNEQYDEPEISAMAAAGMNPNQARMPTSTNMMRGPPAHQYKQAIDEDEYGDDDDVDENFNVPANKGT